MTVDKSITAFRLLSILPDVKCNRIFMAYVEKQPG